MSSRRSIPTADRISALPDSVLCHILSFLPTKHAVATSILSKRWRPLCLSLHTLDFDEETFPPDSDFRHSVYSLLLSRDTTLSLHSFHLKLSNSSKCDQYDINRFVNFATQRGIENLTLHIDLFGGITLPRCVLGATTLVVLKLKMIMVNDLPYVNFPSLKTLHLDCVTFMSYEYLEKLLCMCPILEDLQSADLDIDDYKRFLPHGEVKMFPNLVRANISGPHIPFTSQINVDFLQEHMTNVDALDYDLPTFHTLIDLELTFDRHNCYRRWKWVLEVLGHCPKLQNLTILDLSDTASGEWEEPPTVAECLSSQLRTCSLANYRGDSCELQFAKYIMQNSKVLGSMTIHSSCEEPDPDIDTHEKLQMLMKLSQCQRGSATYLITSQNFVASTCLTNWNQGI